jgi:ribonuclease HII
VAQTSITFGDRRSLSIAAASVVAKVARDRAMQELDEQYPGYGFAHHKGYGTPEHQACLRLLGPSPAHRVSFAPIAQRRLPGLEMPLAKRAEARP